MFEDNWKVGKFLAKHPTITSISLQDDIDFDEDIDEMLPNLRNIEDICGDLLSKLIAPMKNGELV